LLATEYALHHSVVNVKLLTNRLRGAV